MPDDSLPNHLTLTCGLSGYGKTCFDIAVMLNARLACRFIFDAWKDNEISRRTRRRAVFTKDDCEAQLACKWVCFDPRCYASKGEGLKWFAEWASQVSKRGPGAKILYIPEYRMMCNGLKQPPQEVESIARGVSRADGLQLLLSAQHPRDFSLDIRAEVTEWVCFHLEIEEDIEVVKEFFPAVDMVKDFPPGKFVAYSPRSRSMVFGQLELGWPPGRFRPVAV